MKKPQNSIFFNKKLKKPFFLAKIMFFEWSIAEIIKIFHQRRGISKKTISFLKEQKTGYLPMHLSQFRNF